MVRCPSFEWKNNLFIQLFISFIYCLFNRENKQHFFIKDLYNKTLFKQIMLKQIKQKQKQQSQEKQDDQKKQMFDNILNEKQQEKKNIKCIQQFHLIKPSTSISSLTSCTYTTKALPILSGFYPVYLYIPIYSILNAQIKQIIESFKHYLCHDLEIPSQSLIFFPQQSYHLTLTKTINILHHQVQQLVEQLKRMMSYNSSRNSGKKSIHNNVSSYLPSQKSSSTSQALILPIVLLIKKISILQNFITLQVQSITSNKLKELLKIISPSNSNKFPSSVTNNSKIIKNKIIDKYNLRYFQQPIFHISIGKLLLREKDQKDVVNDKALQSLPSSLLPSSLKKQNNESIQSTSTLKQQIQSYPIKNKKAMLLKNIFMKAGCKNMQIV